MRIRITFSKSGTLRYISHLDLHRVWERTCRRAGIPLSYSQGFHPQPRISLAAALPLGFIGIAELMDLWLDRDEELKEILTRLQTAAPPGLILTSIQVVEPHKAALQTQVQYADYEILFLDQEDIAMISTKIEAILSSKSILRERRSRNYDLRPLIKSIQLISSTDQPTAKLLLRLSASPSATGRPEEVLGELGIKPENTRISRSGLVLETN